MINITRAQVINSQLTARSQAQETDRLQRINAMLDRCDPALRKRVLESLQTIQRSARRVIRRARLRLKRSRQETRLKILDIAIYLVFLIVFTLSTVIVIQDQDIYWLVGCNIALFATLFLSSQY